MLCKSCSHVKGLLGDQKWFLSATYIQGVSIGREKLGISAHSSIVIGCLWRHFCRHVISAKCVTSIIKSLQHLGNTSLSSTHFRVMEFNSMKVYSNSCLRVSFISSLHKDLFKDFILGEMLILKFNRLSMHRKFNDLREMSPMLNSWTQFWCWLKWWQQRLVTKELDIKKGMIHPDSKNF